MPRLNIHLPSGRTTVGFGPFSVSAGGRSRGDGDSAVLGFLLLVIFVAIVGGIVFLVIAAAKFAWHIAPFALGIGFVLLLLHGLVRRRGETWRIVCVFTATTLLVVLPVAAALSIHGAVESEHSTYIWAIGATVFSVSWPFAAAWFWRLYGVLNPKPAARRGNEQGRD